MKKKKNNNKRKSSKCKRLKRSVGQTTKKDIKAGRDVYIKMVAVKINHKALHGLMDSIAPRPAETGGVLLGPPGKNYITDFYFDRTGSCTNGTYSPDSITINRNLHKYWEPAGLEIKGIVHSHPGNLDSLTNEDMSYIRRLMVNKLDIDMFVAPIVLPRHYAVRPLVVLRNKMGRAQQAYFEIVD